MLLHRRLWRLRETLCRPLTVSRAPPPTNNPLPLPLPTPPHSSACCLFQFFLFSNERAGQECRLESSAAFNWRHAAGSPVMTSCISGTSFLLPLLLTPLPLPPPQCSFFSACIRLSLGRLSPAPLPRFCSGTIPLRFQSDRRHVWQSVQQIERPWHRKKVSHISFSPRFSAISFPLSFTPSFLSVSSSTPSYIRSHSKFPWRFK